MIINNIKNIYITYKCIKYIKYWYIDYEVLIIFKCPQRVFLKSNFLPYLLLFLSEQPNNFENKPKMLLIRMQTMMNKYE